MKRILIVTPGLQRGGMERQLSEFLHRFNRQYFQISLALFKKNIYYDIPDDVKVIHLNRGGKYDFFFYIKLVILILNPKYDIINSKIRYANKKLMLLCGLFYKKNLIIEIRNSGKQLHPYYKNMAFYYKTLKMKWPIISNNKNAIKELTSFIPENIQKVYIPNGIDTEKFSPKKKENTSKEKWTLGFVGGIKSQKNIESLFEAIYQFKNISNIDIELILVGGTYPAESSKFYYQKLLNLEKALNIEKYITWTGKVEDTENYYEKFDLFILPSHYEGTPNTLLEAMSSGCICIASEDANTDKILSEKFTFTTTSTEDLVNKIIKISQLNSHEIATIKNDNRNFVINNYGMDKMISNYTNFFLNPHFTG